MDLRLAVKFQVILHRSLCCSLISSIVMSISVYFDVEVFDVEFGDRSVVV